MTAAFTTPIAGDAPAGADLSYEPELEPVAAEIEKLTALVGEAPNWHLVATESERLLRERTKDLRIACWYVAARANLEGWRGIAAGLEALVAITGAFWPVMFPPAKRPRARAGLVEWLWKLLARRVTALSAGRGDADAVRAIEPLLAAAAAFFAGELKDADPGLGALRVAFREKLAALPPEAAAPAPAPPPPPPPPPAEPLASQPSEEPGAPATQRETSAAAPAAPVAPVPAPAVDVAAVDPGRLANLDATLDAARGLRDALLTLGHHGRAVAPTSSWGYRVLRVALWLTVDAPPEAQSGVTPLRGPSAADREILASLESLGRWDELAEAAEERAGEHVFWLDAHRLSALALERKGAAFREARRVVAEETLAFVTRARGVADLAFADGTPFASPATKDWLAALKPAAGGGGGGAVAPADDALGDFGARVAAALEPDALAALLAEATRLASPRERFRARLLVANRAQADGLLDVAAALHERLLPEVTPTLEAWEPALAADLLAHHLQLCRRLFRSKERTPAEEEVQEQKETQIFQRLLTLDPHSALRARA